MIYYIFKWMKMFCRQFPFSLLLLIVSLFFFFYLHFCILCHFEIMMHCEISDRYFNVFVEIQMEQKNLKSVFWASEFGCPNQYTSLPNGLNTSLRVGPGQLVLCDSTFTCQESGCVWISINLTNAIWKNYKVRKYE